MPLAKPLVVSTHVSGSPQRFVGTGASWADAHGSSLFLCRMESELAQRAALDAAQNGGAAPEQDSASDNLLDLLPAPPVR